MFDSNLLLLLFFADNKVKLDPKVGGSCFSHKKELGDLFSFHLNTKTDLLGPYQLLYEIQGPCHTGE